MRYAAISYRTPGSPVSAALSVCWWGDMPFLSHAYDLLKVPVIEAILHFGAGPIRNQDRKELARDLHQAVSNIFRPVVDHLPDGAG